MDGQDDGILEMDLKSLSNAMFKVLTIEQRIEMKLDAVLASILPSKAASQRELAQMQAMPAMLGDCGAAMDSYLTGQRSGESPCADEFEPSPFASSGSKLGGDVRSRMHSLKSGVQMRSAFQILIDEEICSDEDSIECYHSEVEICGWESVVVASRKHWVSDYIPINPNSVVLLMWSAFTILVLVAQLAYVPYDLAWNVDLGVAPTCVAVFWSLDVCMSFLTGTYSVEGEKNSLRVSARAYALSSFPLDFFLMLMDWISVLDLGGSNAVKLLRFSKLARMLKIVAVLRISKIGQNARRMIEIAELANRFAMISRVANLCMSVLWFLHVVACFWFLIGNIGFTDNGERWLDHPIPRADGTMMDLSTQTHGWQYVICFHWSVATFTLGNIEVAYANVFERVFGIVLTIISFLFGSVLISLLSALFLDHQTTSMENTGKLRTLRRFLYENDVSNTLAFRIQKVCLERVKMKDRLTFGDTKALENLPPSLYKELRHDIMGRFLKTHDLFHYWSIVNTSVVEEFSFDGIDIIFLKPADKLFKAKAESDYAYFFSSGALTYSKADNKPGSDVRFVPAGTWLSEAALWSQWRHVGTCEAQSRCRIAAARNDRLAHHAHKSLTIRAITLSYCRLFCRALASARPPTAEVPDDLCVPFTKFEEMLVHFPNSLQIFIGTESIRVSELGRKSAAKLQQEIDERECVVYFNIDCELERIVSFTVLVLKNAEGHALYQVGKFAKLEGGWEAEPDLQVLGCKQDRGELPEDTLRRLVNRKINILNGKFEHVSTRVEEESVFSEEFSVKTRYLRTQIVCSMREVFPATLVAGVFHLEDMTPRKFRSKVSDPVAPNKSLKEAAMQTLYRQACSKSKKSVAYQKLVDVLSISAISLYVIFEGTEPFIYAWLSPELADALEQSSPHQRDEVLSRLLTGVDLRIIQDYQHQEPQPACDPNEVFL